MFGITEYETAEGLFMTINERDYTSYVHFLRENIKDGDLSDLISKKPTEIKNVHGLQALSSTLSNKEYGVVQMICQFTPMMYKLCGENPNFKFRGIKVIIVPDVLISDKTLAEPLFKTRIRKSTKIHFDSSHFFKSLKVYACPQQKNMLSNDKSVTAKPIDISKEEDVTTDDEIQDMIEFTSHCTSIDSKPKPAAALIVNTIKNEKSVPCLSESFLKSVFFEIANCDIERAFKTNETIDNGVLIISPKINLIKLTKKYFTNPLSKALMENLSLKISNKYLCMVSVQSGYDIIKIFDKSSVNHSTNVGIEKSNLEGAYKKKRSEEKTVDNDDNSDRDERVDTRSLTDKNKDEAHTELSFDAFTKALDAVAMESLPTTTVTPSSPPTFKVPSLNFTSNMSNTAPRMINESYIRSETNAPLPYHKDGPMITFESLIEENKELSKSFSLPFTKREMGNVIDESKFEVHEVLHKVDLDRISLDYHGFIQPDSKCKSINCKGKLKTLIQDTNHAFYAGMSSDESEMLSFLLMNRNC